MVLLDEVHLKELAQQIGAAPAYQGTVPCWWQLALELGFNETAVASINIEQQRRLGTGIAGGGAEFAIQEACALQMLKVWRDQLKASIERKCALLHKGLQTLGLAEIERDLCHREYLWLSLL